MGCLCCEILTSMVIPLCMQLPKRNIQMAVVSIIYGLCPFHKIHRLQLNLDLSSYISYEAIHL